MKNETVPTHGDSVVAEFKAGRVRYRIERGTFYGKPSFHPILAGGFKISKFSLAPGVGGHLSGVPSLREARQIIERDVEQLREIGAIGRRASLIKL